MWSNLILSLIKIINALSKYEEYLINHNPYILFLAYDHAVTMTNDHTLFHTSLSYTAKKIHTIYVFPEKKLRASVLFYTFMYLWAIYIFSRSVHLLSCSSIGKPIVGIYKSLTETWMSEFGKRTCSVIYGNICFEFSVWCICRVVFPGLLMAK